VISSPLLVILGLGALSASLALLMARLEVPLAAHVFAIGGALLGMTAFVVTAVATVRSARRLPWGPRQR
jgi:hypothetical protein